MDYNYTHIVCGKSFSGTYPQLPWHVSFAVRSAVVKERVMHQGVTIAKIEAGEKRTELNKQVEAFFLFRERSEKLESI